MPSTVLTRAMNKTESLDSDKKFSYSAWIKRSDLLDGCIIEGYYSSTFHSQLYFDSNTNLTLNCASGTAGSAFQIVTNRKFRDTSAWYHIFLLIDTGDATASDRAKIYVNGVRETSFSSATYPNQNSSHQFSRNGNTTYIGRRNGGGSGLYFNGSMSHINTTSGHPNPAGVTEFGETDATTGEWKIKTAPSVTYGNNGFFILKDGNSLTDQSGESNDFTLNQGTLTKTEDNPSNNFPTFNISLPIPNTSYIENGALMAETFASGNYLAGMSSLGMPRDSGIYYCEIMLIAESATGESCIGVCSEEAFTQQDAGTVAIVGNNYNWGIRNNNGLEYYNGGQGTSKHGNFSAGDIMGVYFDSTNDRLTYSKNGGWWNGTSSWSGTSPDLVNYFVGTASGNYKTFFFNCGDSGNTVSAKWAANFGNGYFGQNAIDSAGTIASGNGIFEFDTPTGARALSTKGLNL